MNYIGSVSSEGGPLLIGDCSAFYQWQGVETDDYNQLIDSLDAEDVVITLGENQVACWDPEGGGITYIYENYEAIYLIRGFEQELAYFCEYPIDSRKKIGEISVASNLTVLYATEPGTLLKNLDPEFKGSLSHSDLAFEESILLFGKGIGRISCYSDYIYEEEETVYRAKRLILVKEY